MNTKLEHLLSNNGLYWLTYYFLSATRIKKLLSDKAFLKLQYRCLCGKPLNIKHPQTYNEKLQWLKVYNQNPLYTKLVDKALVKNYVAELIGEDHIIPTIAVYNRVEEIEWEKLPNQFVIKCTHDSGGNVICHDKSQLNIESAQEKLSRCLKHNFYWDTREWPYKNVKPRIIVEKYMTDGDGELKDYKFFCFDGTPKALFIATDRFTKNVETKFDYFDMDFNHLSFRGGHPNSEKPIQKPDGFDQMKEMASKLSVGFPHVRVDLYYVDGKIYFGEYTFYHWGGMMPFEPEEWNHKFGSWITLPKNV